MKKFLLQIIGINILIALLLAGANAVYAVGASPLRIEYTGNPGEVPKGQLSVVNTSDKPKIITITKSDFKVDYETEKVKFINGADSNYEHSLKNWIILEKNTYNVNPQSKAVIPYEIHIPENAKSQGYYGTLFVESAASNNNMQQKTGNTLNIGVAHLILLEVKGDAFEDTKIQNLNVTANSDKNEAEITIVFYNNGNTHSSPEGSLEIINQKGRTLEITDLNTGKRNILPKTKKTFIHKCPADKLPPGKYSIIFKGLTKKGTPLEGEALIKILLKKTHKNF